jgi:hypothetical protein
VKSEEEEEEEEEFSIKCSQGPPTCVYPDPDELNPRLAITFI